MRSGRANPSASGQIWMIRRFTSAQFVPADAGSKDKNPMGSALLSTPIIAPTNLDRHQSLRNFCHESVRKRLKSVACRVVDRRVLHLIKMWLACPVEETDDRGRKTRKTEARDK